MNHRCGEQRAQHPWRHSIVAIGIVASLAMLTMVASCSNKRIASDVTLAPLPPSQTTTPRSTTTSLSTNGSAPGTSNPNVTRPSTAGTMKPPTSVSPSATAQPPTQTSAPLSTQPTTAPTSPFVPPTTTKTTTSVTVPTPPTTKPTVPPPTTLPTPRPGPATDLLAAIPVSAEHGGFRNNAFGGWTTDGAGCDTSERVLIRDSTATVKLEHKSCRVRAGRWVSVWDQSTWTDPARLSVTQVVPLSEAWQSGAWSWSQQRRDAFVNDTSDQRSLAVIADSVSQSRGDRDPAGWLPPSGGQVCRYIADWLSIKARWGLTMDSVESSRIGTVLNDQCPGLVVGSWSSP